MAQIDTQNVGTTAVQIVADNRARREVTNQSGGTVYYKTTSDVSSGSNDGSLTEGSALEIVQTKYFISASSSRLVIESLVDTTAEDISAVDDLTVGGDATVGGTLAVTGAQTLTGATTHSAAITGTHADGLVLSANGGKDTLALSNTTADVGLTIGADTNLYRSAANTLKTDDALTVTGATTLAAGITGTHADGLVLSANGGKDTLALSDTTADVGLTIGADTNLYRSAANTLKTDDALVAASTLAVTGASTLTGAATVSGGVIGLGVVTRIPTVEATTLTYGVDKTPVTTETALAEIQLVSNATLTGIEILVGSVGGTDSAVVALFDSAGVAVAWSALAGTTVGTTAQFQRIPFTGTYAAKGPGQYFIGLQVNGTTARYRTIPVGPRLATAVKTGETFGTLTTITAPTTFTADIGPVAGTY